MDSKAKTVYVAAAALLIFMAVLAAMILPLGDSPAIDEKTAPVFGPMNYDKTTAMFAEAGTTKTGYTPKMSGRGDASNCVQYGTGMGYMRQCETDKFWIFFYGETFDVVKK